MGVQIRMGRGNFEGERDGPLKSIGNTVRVWQRCGLLSNYFDHLLSFGPYHVFGTGEVSHLKFGVQIHINNY